MTAGEPPVDVALATYNGERFLPEFLSTVERQTYPNIRIVAADDGSSDETCAILQRSGRLSALVERGPNDRKGIVANFERALKVTEAPYVALADQDDAWDLLKIELMLSKARELEDEHGAQTPILVFSDLAVVAHDLSVIQASFFASTTKDASAKTFKDFALGNHVPGCAMFMNRALVKLALPMPEIYMHDWWIIQLASLVGKIAYLERPLIHYRQHGGNAEGLGSAAKPLALRVAQAALSPGKRAAGWRKRAAMVQSSARHLKIRLDAGALNRVDSELIDALASGGDPVRVWRLLRGARSSERAVDQLGILANLRR